MSGLATVPLKRVASFRVSNVDKKTVDGEQPVRLCNYTDVYHCDTIRPGQEFMSATASGEQVAAFRLRPGDVIITKDSETADDIGVPAYVEAGAPDLICGYHLALIRPNDQAIDGHFLFWSMASAVVRDQFAASATGVTRFGLRSDSIGGVLIPLPPVQEQQAIADFLDAETARIDTLISKKRRLVTLADEHVAALAEHVVWADAPETVPLKRRTQPGRPIMYGIVLPGPNVAEGVPIVKGGDVASGRLSSAQLNRTTPELEAPYARARLRRGDLVFAIRGGIGDVQIVPIELEGANITQDVARVAPARDVDERWLKAVLETSSVRGQVEARTTGATIRGLNIWELQRIQVPASDPQRQQGDLEFLVPASQRGFSLTSRLTRQIALLQERRQALITAAVTGELDIAGAA